jgi:Flp pilus assembly protein TadG
MTTSRNAPRRAPGGNDRGQSLVEFALVIPVLVILVFGIIDFGMGLRAYITVTQATREGARFGAVGNDPGTFTSGGAGQCNGSTTTTIVGKVCTTMNGLSLSDLSSVSVTYPGGRTTGQSVRVSAQYQYDYITPLDTILNALSGGSVGDHITLSNTTDMRLE